MATEREAILVISERVPFPSDNGGKLRTANMLLQLAKRYDVDFVAYSQDAVSEEQRTQLAAVCKNVFIFAEGYPSKGKHVRHFLGNRSGIACCVYSPNMQQTIDACCVQNRYRLLWIERLFCFPYVEKRLRKVGNHPPVILNMHDVDHEAVAYFGKVERSFAKRLYYRFEYARVLRLEEQAFHAAHRLISVSQRDMRLYCEKYPFSQGKWLFANNGVDLGIAAGASPLEREAQKVLFIGGLDNPCNRHGICWFVEQVWPKVLENCPDAELWVAGSGKAAGDMVARLGKSVRTTFLGYVPDIVPLYQRATCLVVPLLSGSGTRLKIVEAFSFRLPVVSTSIGAEGLRVTNGRELVIADGIQPFAHGVSQVLESLEMQLRMGDYGYAVARDQYAWDGIMTRLIGEVEASLQ